MRAWMLFLLLACMSSAAHAKEFTAKIIAVLDGDTVLIRQASGLVKIRLAEIDAPEVGHAGMGGQPPNSQKAQAFGDVSKRSLSDMVLGKQVKVVSQATDQYGRMVAHLSVNGLDVNVEQIRLGMAWAAVGWRQSRRAPTGAPTGAPLAGAYSNFASSAASSQSLQDPLHSNKALIALQEEARQAPRGLWAQANPTPPWEWRKQHPSTLPAQPNAAVLPASAHTDATSLDPTCGNKKHCSEVASCDEAKHYLAQCGVKTLDGDGDGLPCEKLCDPQKK